MYITNTTDNVRNLIEKLEEQDDITKLKFLIYIFGLLNNNQINNKNESNPNLVEDENFEIFTLDLIGMSENANIALLQYFMLLYNRLTDSNILYESNGNILGMINDDIDIELNLQFEKLSYNEKLDIFSEIIIRYDNGIYFQERLTFITFSSKNNGFDIANAIKNYKNSKKK